MHTHTLVLDAGTTTIKAFIFNKNNKIIGEASVPTKKIYPHAGWVEQDPKKIVSASRRVLRAALKNSKLSATQISSMGITNQRETIVAWNATTGAPVYNAIVWEDTRTIAECKKLAKFNSFVLTKSEHPIIPYFSATKIAWILKNVTLAKKLLVKNQLRVGTIDSWLLWNLCAEHPHTTDATNASRTLLMDAKKQIWDKKLCAIFGVPLKILPKIQPTQSIFGKLKSEILSATIPVKAVIGDQQSSMHAARVFARQNKIRAPFAKITFGTGAFIMMDAQKNQGGIEIKIENCAARVSKALKNKKQLLKTLTVIAAEVAVRLKDLPRQPTALIIDGGVTRDGLICPILARTTKLPVFQLKQYNGTALGAALLAKK